MKVFKRIVAILGITCTLTTVNCFAMTQDSDKIINKNNVEYVYRNYTISQDEESNFLDNIQKEITLNNKKYTFQDKTVKCGNTTKSKQITKSKKITSKTDNKEKLINELGISEDYSDDEGYIGEYFIDENSFSIKINYNGYYEYLIEEIKEYSNLEKNDLDYLPKQIQKDNMTLDLLNISWKVENTKLYGDNEVPDKYTAVCYYATKKRVDNPATYTVTANYIGEATKTTENPLQYTLLYKEVKEEITEPIPEEKDNNFIPILGGVSTATTFFVVVFFFIRRNANIYNLQNGKWVLVGKIYLSKKPRINLDKFAHLEVTSKYKIELSKKAVNNVYGKFIEISKENRVIKHMVKQKDDTCSFEINM